MRYVTRIVWREFSSSLTINIKPIICATSTVNQYQTNKIFVSLQPKVDTNLFSHRIIEYMWKEEYTSKQRSQSGHCFNSKY